MSVKVFYDYIAKPLISNGFAASFLFFRTFTPFRENDHHYYKIAEGSLFAAVAVGVQYCVINSYLKSYSYSHLPTVFSASYHNNILGSENVAVKFIGSTIITCAVASTINSDNIVSLIPPLVTYTVLNINNVLPKDKILGISLLTGVIDSLISHNHPANWFAVGGTIANGVANIYIPNKTLKDYSIPIGGVLGLIASNYEKPFIDQLISPVNFNNSYNALTKFVDLKELNHFLEQHYITMANLQIGVGFLGNYLLTKTQDKTTLFANIEKGKTVKFNEFLELSFKYIGIATYYTIIRILSDVAYTYANRQSIVYLQEKLLNNDVLNKENFIQISKTNYSVPSYLGDIETIADSCNKIIQQSLFGISKLSKIGNLNPIAYLGLAGIMLNDYILNIGFQFLTKLNQEFAREQLLCESQFSKINEHDKEYAVTILQKNGLNYSIAEWRSVQECYSKNNLGKDVVTTIIGTLQSFYNQHILYTGLHMIVGYMSFVGEITSSELFLYTRTLETLTDTILFKSKNQAAFGAMTTAIDRLERLDEYLYSINNTIKAIDYIVDGKQDFLLVQNLEFIRGSKEQTSRLFIDKLELSTGNIYAITGANGSGKSSFATLLQYVLEQIADLSFIVKSGYIAYPASSISMITQKDYVPFNVSLVDLILYPNTDKLLYSQNKQKYEQQVINNVNELQVFKNNVTSQSIYEVQDSWKDLSGGQKKKLGLVSHFIDCPKVIIMDEVFGPLDASSRSLVMNKIKGSCLKDSLILIVWHQDKNPDNTACVVDPFFDYEVHLSNESVVIAKVGEVCLGE